MAFTVDDVQDLIRLLAQHPEWRAELRPLILGDEILGLPASMRELSAAQARTEAALDRLTGRVEELAAAQSRTETRVEELAAAQARTEARVDQLSRAIEDLTATVAVLAQEHHRVGDRLGFVDGRWLEQRFYDRAPSYFGPFLRRPHVVELPDLGAVEALDEGRLSQDDYDQIASLDVLFQGTERDGAGEQVVLAVEVSTQIKDADITRARQRARILERLGYKVIPTVGGEKIGPAARRLAESHGVLVRLVRTE
jgi:outer membrane murein-binding lipoprotein Lpp